MSSWPSCYLIAIVGTALRYDGQLVRLAGFAAVVQYVGIVSWAHATERINVVTANFYGDSTFGGQAEEICILLMTTVLGSILVERARELRLSGIRDPLPRPRKRELERLQALRTAVATSVVPWHGKTIGITVSIGLALAPEDGSTPESLLTAADARLLAGKRSGRNVVVAAAATLEV